MQFGRTTGSFWLDDGSVIAIVVLRRFSSSWAGLGYILLAAGRYSAFHVPRPAAWVVLVRGCRLHEHLYL